MSGGGWVLFLRGVDGGEAGSGISGCVFSRGVTGDVVSLDNLKGKRKQTYTLAADAYGGPGHRMGRGQTLPQNWAVRREGRRIGMCCRDTGNRGARLLGLECDVAKQDVDLGGGIPY
jgi:hypothetical protein